MRGDRMIVIMLSFISYVLFCAFTSSPFDRISADHTPPTVTLSINEPSGENGWHNQPVFARVKARDDGSGVRIAQVSIGGKTWYQDALRIAIDGEFMVIAQAVDRAGNKARVTQIVKIDMTPPVALLKVPEPDGENGFHVSVVPVIVTGTDALSGVVDAGIEAIGSQKFAGTNASETTARVSIIESGLYTVDGFVKDQAGNITPVSTQLAVDLDAPVVKINAPMEFKGEIPLNGIVVDDISGVRSIAVDYGSGWQPITPRDTQWNIVWPAGGLKDGDYPIRAKAEDLAGNETIIIYQASILNTLWPFFALFTLMIGVGAYAAFDPRKKEIVLLTAQIQQHNRMYQNSIILGLEMEED